MNSRYSDQRISGIWSETSQYARWYEVERFWLDCCFNIKVPILYLEPYQLDKLVEQCRIEEEKLNHDVAAFVKVMEVMTGTPYVHFGLTSSDVTDTALMMGMRQSCEHLASLLSTLHDQLSIHRGLTCVDGPMQVPARTHGAIAEPIPSGTLHNRWMSEISYAISTLTRLQFYGKFSGSVGTHQGLPTMKAQFELAEQEALKKLQLNKCEFTTQVLPRELFLDVFMALLKVSSILARMATQLRLFASHGELTKTVTATERGSSSMPHKVNPIGFEKVCGMHRLVEANFGAASQNCLLWAERDISHSSVERIIIPDTFHTVAHQISTMIHELPRWVFNRIKIGRSLSQGQHGTQAVMLQRIIDGAPTREEAYLAAIPAG